MRKVLISITILALIAWVVWPTINSFRRHHPNPEKQAVWLWNHVLELQSKADLQLPKNRDVKIWAEDGFLVFSNGWATYACHTIHDVQPEIGDVALLRTSEGIFYVCNYHFCIEEGSFNVEDRPRDFAHFMEMFGSKHGWHKEASVSNSVVK